MVQYFGIVLESLIIVVVVVVGTKTYNHSYIIKCNCFVSRWSAT